MFAPQPALLGKHCVMMFASILKLTKITVEAVALWYVLPSFCVLEMLLDLANVFEVSQPMPQRNNTLNILSTRNLWFWVS